MGIEARITDLRGQARQHRGCCFVVLLDTLLAKNIPVRRADVSLKIIESACCRVSHSLVGRACYVHSEER